MGVWDKIEAADFPVKIGATYLWGKDPELWDFGFIPPNAYLGNTRPAKFEGIRQMTALQADRALYDDILLRHAAALGCTVLEETAVRGVTRTAAGHRPRGALLGPTPRFQLAAILRSTVWRMPPLR